MSTVNNAIDFNNVNLNQEQDERAHRWLRGNSSGLILVTGCMDELISTACLAVLEKVYSIYAKARIITLEYSIKYHIDFAIQVKIAQNASFTEHLPGVVRHNGDVLYIEKIQTQEEVDAVLRILHSGYMVVSSIKNDDKFEGLINLNTLVIPTSHASSTLA